MGLPDGRTKDCGHPEAEWSFKIRIGGKQKLFSSWKLKKDAENKAEEIKRDIRSGKVIKEIKPMLFSELAETWYKAKCVETWATGSKYNNRLYLDCYILPVFGKQIIFQIEAIDAEKFKNKLLETLSKSTCAYIISSLRDIFRYGKKFDLVRENPLIDIKCSVPKKKLDPNDIFTLDEIHKILNVKKEPIHTILVVAVGTGLRQGEIAALTWRSLNFKDDTIFINKNISRVSKKFTKSSLGWEMKEPKTANSTKVIKMTKNVKEALLNWQKRALNGHTAVSGFVFPGRFKDSPLSGQAMWRWFKKILVETGIDTKRFHDIRHTFASLAIAQNVHPKALQELMRHGDIQTTLGTYGHLMPGIAGDAATKIDSLLDSHDTTVIPPQMQVPANNGK